MPGEVLINFMTKDISRFVDDEDSSALQSFIDLFGDASYRAAWRGLRELDREDRIVETYCARVREAGDFTHCAATVILNPQYDRTHYHLVYATRSLHGLVAFRDTERKAIPAQHEARAEAKQRERVGFSVLIVIGAIELRPSWPASRSNQSSGWSPGSHADSNTATRPSGSSIVHSRTAPPS